MTGESVAPGEEGLKPCPACGEKPDIAPSKTCDRWVICLNRKCPTRTYCEDIPAAIREWNDFWCWKEISALTERCALLEKENKELSEIIEVHCDEVDKENAELRRHADALAAALNNAWPTSLALTLYEQFREKEGGK